MSPIDTDRRRITGGFGNRLGPGQAKVRHQENRRGTCRARLSVPARRPVDPDPQPDLAIQPVQGHLADAVQSNPASEPCP